MKRVFYISYLGFVCIIGTLLDFLLYSPVRRFRDMFVHRFRVVLLNVHEKYRAVINLYDANGLKHSLAYLSHIENEVIFMPLEKQAEFVDEMVIGYVKRGSEKLWYDEDFYTDNFLNLSSLNTTTIGNLAYLALHSQYDDVKKRAKELLQIIRENTIL